VSFRSSRRHHKVLQGFKDDLFGRRKSPRNHKLPRVTRLPAQASVHRPQPEEVGEADQEYASPCIYQKFYGFKRPPFNNTPDPNFFFMSQKHSESLSRLLYAAQSRKGFVLLSGEIGSGKTTVCRALINKLRLTSKVALVTNTSISGSQLVRMIAEEFELETENKSKWEIISELNGFLISQLANDRNVILILDEAQNLSNQVLEEVRMLSNLETTQEKLIQIFLVGQPELRQKVNAPELKQLRQRIALRFHLKPLDEQESRDYIAHRLRVANAVCPPRFPEASLELIYEYSEGIPRVINTVCDNALIEGFVKETFKIGRDIVEEVINDLEGITIEEEKEPRKPSSFMRRLRQALGGRR
jgi:general secretion pathway protein A